MKKTVCIILALILSLSLISVAFAADVTASYADGKLTVSTTANYYFRIIVDGHGTMRSLTPRVPSLTFEYELSDGTHKVSLSSDIVGGGSTTITIVNGRSVDGAEAEPTPEPTPTPAPTPAPHTQHKYDNVEAKEPTCTEDGYTAGVRCALGGEIVEGLETIPAPGHQYVLISREKGMAEYRCVRCDDTFQVKVTSAVADRLGYALVRDAEGERVAYTAKPTKANSTILLIKAEPEKKNTSEIGLYLTGELLEQLAQEGFDRVEFVNGKAYLMIELGSITAEWFDTDADVAAFVFSTDPAAAEGTLVKVEAQISDTEKLEATAFEGVTLLR